MKWEHEVDIQRLKIIYGFRIGGVLVVLFGVLALTIAIGNVRQETSFGLGMVLGGLNTAIGAFANWAWQTSRAQKLSVMPKPKPAEDETSKAA